MSGETYPWWKKALFGGVFAVVACAILLAGAELILRAVGYGHAPGFWRKEKDASGQTWIRENWWVTAPFFAPELARRPQPFRVPETKAPENFRIFVLGSSAAMGDPEPSFSIARVLETMLRAAYPKVHFEVINASVTAINSHVVRGIAEDCAKLQPDLFIVYEGNNEVIGPFGPGTVFTPVLRSSDAIRAAIFLRGLRLGQALTAVARRARGPAGAPEDWDGMQMFLQHEIAADDPRLQVTENLFADNLRAIVRAGQQSGANVILATVLTNQKDFAPFQSRHRTGLTAEQVANAEAALRAGRGALARSEWIEAEKTLRASLAIDDAFAETHFWLGRALLRQNRNEEAKTELQRALDLDVLRFRTDSRLNETIRRVARDSGGAAELADLAQAAGVESPGGVVGDELLYEHVHLSLRGAYLVARQLFSQVSEDLRRRGRIEVSNTSSAPLSIDEVRQRLAFTVYDQAMIGREMISRLGRAPFTSQSTNSERLAGFQQRDARASQLLSRPESAEAIFAIYEQAIAHAPDDWVLHRNYGMALAAMKHGDRAKPHLLKALEIIPDDPDTLYGLIIALKELGETENATKRIEQLRALAPRYPGLSRL